MWRFANPKEAVQWLRSNSPGRPTGFYLWGSIYVQRALWDGFAWRWLARRNSAMPDRRFWDGLAFGFTASLTLWQDLPPIQVMVVLVVLFGAAIATVGGGE
jgi:hypothetical protein